MAVRRQFHVEFVFVFASFYRYTEEGIRFISSGNGRELFIGCELQIFKDVVRVVTCKVVKEYGQKIRATGL